MKTALKLVFGLVIGSCMLLGGAMRGDSLPTQTAFIACPTHLIAPYGGMDGWSTINVQANFARAVISPTKMMTCQYRFGSGPVFFGIQKPCPVGSRCIVVRNGFRILPQVIVQP